MEQRFQPGIEVVMQCDSGDARYSVFFEDDGETGYFYALDLFPELKILDGVHIYNVDDVVDRDRVSIASIL